MSFRGSGELPLFIVLTLVCAIVGWLYDVSFMDYRDRFFKPLPIPRQFKPAIGGLLLGIVALKFPEVMAGGYGGAMGRDRYAGIAHGSRRPELHTTYGSKRSPDARSTENRGNWPHDQFRR